MSDIKISLENMSENDQLDFLLNIHEKYFIELKKA